MADRLADNIGLRVRFDAGVDMLGGVWRNCTYVTRVLGPTALPATRPLRKFANEKTPGHCPGFCSDRRKRQAYELRFPLLAPAAKACTTGKHRTEQPDGAWNWSGTVESSRSHITKRERLVAVTAIKLRYRTGVALPNAAVRHVREERVGEGNGRRIDTPVKAKLVYSVFQIASWNAAEVL